MKTPMQSQTTIPLSEVTDDELLDRYYDAVYGSDSNPNRVKEARAIKNELKRRGKATRQWMREHPVEVERVHDEH